MSTRGRKNKELSLLSRSFLQRDKKNLSPTKFADDKSRAFANSLLELDLVFLPEELKVSLQNLNEAKIKFNEKAKKIIEEISLFEGAWDRIKVEFFKMPLWMNRIEVKLKLFYNDVESEKVKIFNDLVQHIFKYLQIKGEKFLKKKNFDSTCEASSSSSSLDFVFSPVDENFSDTCSTNTSPPLEMNDLFESSHTLNFSDFVNPDSLLQHFISGGEPDDLFLEETERKQPESFGRF